MGFRYRKSIRLGGGFRINISGSGVGYSWGVPGYRITKTANGKIRQTASIPGTGLSYSTEESIYKSARKSALKEEPYTTFRRSLSMSILSTMSRIRSIYRRIARWSKKLGSGSMPMVPPTDAIRTTRNALSANTAGCASALTAD